MESEILMQLALSNKTFVFQSHPCDEVYEHEHASASCEGEVITFGFLCEFKPSTHRSLDLILVLWLAFEEDARKTHVEAIGFDGQGHDIRGWRVKHGLVHLSFSFEMFDHRFIERAVHAVGNRVVSPDNHPAFPKWKLPIWSHVNHREMLSKVPQVAVVRLDVRQLLVL